MKKTIKMIKITKMIIGIFIGFISGLFSAGGGLIAIPCFVYLLKINEKKARVLTIFAIFPICITSLFVYNKTITIDYKLGLICALGGVVGGYLGSKLLRRFSEQKLKIIFIIFLVFSGVKLLI